MSSDYNLVLKKIQEFIQKFYINEIIKGILIFLSIALFYFISVLLLESFLWFSTTVRTVLFWLLIGVSIILFIKYIGISVAKLIKLKKQITPLEASKIIGNYFPEIDDQLVNLLQLKNNGLNSDLLIASIAQKSKQLSPLPFSAAINFKSSLSYAKYLAIPFLLFLFFSIFNGFNWYKNSFNRVVNYNIAFEPPAPFYFNILNKNLNALQNNEFTLKVKVLGKALPHQVQIAYQGETYFLIKSEDNIYSYKFSSPTESFNFHLFSGNVNSKPYQLVVNKVPSITDFDLEIIPPKHTLKKQRIINNSGAAVVPEGSQLKWKLKSLFASKIDFIQGDSIFNFNKTKSFFSYNKRIKNTIDYQISTSNSHVNNYENLAFTIDVIKDQNPLINVLEKRDSISNLKKYYYGTLSDDYGIKKLNVSFYKVNNPNAIQHKSIPIKQGLTTDFTFQFPNDLDLEEATSYAYYFEVFDNDSFNGFKSSKSPTFNYTVLTRIQKQEIESKSNQEQLKNFENTIEKFQESEFDLESFSKLQKQSISTTFKEKEKLSSLLDQQLKSQKKLKDLTQKLDKTLDKLDENEDKKLTKEELKRAKKELERNLKLIEEIKKAIEKLTPLETKKKVDELKKENKKLTKNLSQILELTKRYYVIDKHQRIIQMLELLSKKQIEISKSDANLESQNIINKEYQVILNELDDLRESNAKLRKPMILDDDSVYEGKIKTKLNEAIENIKSSQLSQAQKKQNVAGVMMKNLADKMSNTNSGGGGDQLEDDKELLRQVLDNLVLFSINQESNMNNFSETHSNSPNYSKLIRNQNELREHFNHIDDSLFVISSRNPKVGTSINDLISDIDFNLNSSLESITDNKTYQGITKLRFVISNSNDLAVMLSESLKLIDQPQKPGSSSESKPQGFQLPDIIKKQESLNKAFQEALQAGQKKPGDSQKTGQGGQQKAGDSGKEGKEGAQGNEGNNGKDGKSGDSGQQGKEGTNGKPGASGNQGNQGESGENGAEGQGKGQGDGASGFSIGQGSYGQGKEQGKGQGQGEGNGESESQGSQSDKKSKEVGKTSPKNNSANSNEPSKGKKSGGQSGNSTTDKNNNSNSKEGKSINRSSGEGTGEGSGEGEGDQENDYELLFEIYKEQQQLRNSLEDKLIEEGIQPNQKRILDQMKAVEDELIEKGFTTETLNRMLNLKHQLFKLDQAQFQQGKDKKRKSKTNFNSFTSDYLLTPEAIKKYFNTTEILNREALPLKPDFKKKVNNYFSN